MHSSIGEKASTEPYVILPFLGKTRIKFIALVLLVGQTVGAVTMMRLSRVAAVTKNKQLYLNTTAVFISEIIKLLGSLFLVWKQLDYSVSRLSQQLKCCLIDNKIEMFKICVPATLYTIQNNLIYIALSNMSAATYQVTYQMKILTTAILSVIILNKKISSGRWCSLIILTIGVIFIQWPTEQTVSSNSNQAPLVGVLAVLTACLTSGFAGVYFEKVLKTTTISIWMRNVQLAIFGSMFALIGTYIKDKNSILENGFFQGYTPIVWVVILLQSAGGLIVAAVLKYADNILKCFGNALAIVLSCCVASFLFNDVTFSFLFVFGTSLVIFSSYAYGMDLKLFYFFSHFVNRQYKYAGMDEEELTEKTYTIPQQPRLFIKGTESSSV